MRKMAAKLDARENAAVKMSMKRQTARRGNRRAHNLEHAAYIFYEIQH